MENPNNKIEFKNFPKIIKNFLNEKSYSNRASSQTIRACNSDLSKILKLWEQNKRSKFENIVDLLFQQTLLETSLKNSTINRMISTFKSFLDFLHKSDYKVAPIDLPEQKKISKSNFDKNFTVEEVDAIISSPQTFSQNPCRDELILELFYSTGIRCSELVNIKFGDLDFVQKTITINKGKGGKPRVVLYGEFAQNKLELFLSKEKNLKDDAYIFTSSNGHRLDPRNIQTIFEKAKSTLNISKTLSPHTMRHCFATHMLSKGASLRTVQKLLGHSNLSTTEVYTQILQEDLSIFMEKLYPKSE